jgi:hypothetical protein
MIVIPFAGHQISSSKSENDAGASLRVDYGSLAKADGEADGLAVAGATFRMWAIERLRYDDSEHMKARMTHAPREPDY